MARGARPPIRSSRSALAVDTYHVTHLTHIHVVRGRSNQMADDDVQFRGAILSEIVTFSYVNVARL